ncbi:hypothetical protein K438DRAFT_1995511 [Mycena galopus ATCC 62051]|nr:hypothetical protein K438DRAFT_1995511 [Mycena galopus ATCC 62051]
MKTIGYDTAWTWCRVGSLRKFRDTSDAGAGRRKTEIGGPEVRMKIRRWLRMPGVRPEAAGCGLEWSWSCTRNSGQQRLDGHGSPSDFTQSPQTYNWMKLWLGFMTRESRSSDEDVEYATTYSIWQNPTLRTGRGRINPAHVDRLLRANEELKSLMSKILPEVEKKQPSLVRHRLQWPNREAAVFQHLCKIVAYEDAVDQLAEAHQSLHEKRAWYTMASLLLRSNQVPCPNDSILSADECYLGVWINGADLNDCWWFLTRAALPCFIIHALPTSESPPPDTCSLFLERTELEKMMDPSLYKFDCIAAGSGCRYMSEEKAPVPYNTRPRVQEEQHGSSLQWQLNRPGENLLIGAQRPGAPPSKASSTGVATSLMRGNLSTSTGDGGAAANSDYKTSALVPVDAD